MEVDPQDNLKRCDELWYADGTVVLQAGTTLFRVYTGILSQYSAIFRDLFAVPQPAVQEQYQGCPLVHLPDTASEVYHLLKVVHDMSFDVSRIRDVTVLGDILRISTKYEVREVRTRAINAFRQSYPTVAAEYAMTKNNPHFEPRSCPARRIYVVNLLRETNTSTLLPAALLFCCHNDLDEILHGMAFNGTHVELSAQDKEIVLMGRHRLTQRARRYSHRTMFYDDPVDWPAATRCKEPKRCYAALSSYLHRFAISGWLNPLEPPVDEDKDDFCADCHVRQKRAFDAYFGNIWNNLPSAFSLPEWGALEETTQLGESLWCTD
ncbi:hypothetical protein EIP86_002138 [Pleurotus ostreatoroseus]|nr:hypothetical protein EIP86_002138 [Pleurotus ostreatoroseus]